MSDSIIENLLSFIDKSPTMFHTIHTCVEELEKEGFTYLDPSNKWEIESGKYYYTKVNDSALIAYRIHEPNPIENGFKIVATHSDTPGFKIKPKAEIVSQSYVTLNTEVYGGPILNTWLDRPLSIAGRISVRSNNPLKPISYLVDLKDPLLVIPNLAIHMNRSVNDGIALNKQKELLPILTYVEEELKHDLLLPQICASANITQEDFINGDLFLYPYEKSTLVGLDKKLISAPRLDDLSMTYSALKALLDAPNGSGISMFVCFDNEEVGSRTRQGADSPFLATVLERIITSLGYSREDYFRILANSFMISADVAHLYHPNYPEKSDPTNKVLPGKGPAIKLSSNFSYTTDCDSYSVFADICKLNTIPYQVFVNRSDERGGSTIGPVSASHLPIRCIDIGTPLLSMHSARELMTTADCIATYDALKAFFRL